jgi:hypothetical protein
MLKESGRETIFSKFGSSKSKKLEKEMNEKNEM